MASSFLVRTFDQAGYYEARVLVTVVVLAVVLWQWLTRKDRAFLVFFCSGVIFQALMEWLLLVFGLRGADYHLNLFGTDLRGPFAWLLQGLVEGGIFGVMGYWLIRFVREKWSNKIDVAAYALLLLLIGSLSTAVSLKSRGQPISSARPMFAELPIVILVLQTALVLAITWMKGQRAFHWLGIYYLGTLVYVLIQFEPMHVLEVRYVAERLEDNSFQAVVGARQFWWMLYSYVFEVAGAKIHYFIIPFVLGLVSFERNEP